MSYRDRALRLIPSATQTYSKSHTRFPAGSPETIRSGEGAYITDDSGREWLDCVSGLGSVILGHNDHDVTMAAVNQAMEGVAFPLPTTLELDLAERIVDYIPSAQMVRFAKNGADACAAAVRIARAVTGRDRVASCGYHGYPDYTIAHQNPRGVPEYAKWGLSIVPYNNLDKMEAAFRVDEPACVIMEPIVATNPVEPLPGYLAGVRALCDKYGALLIFDEVVTFGRMPTGSAQKYYGVTPDLTALGKCLANGYPLSAVCGRADLMRELDNGVFFSTTFGGEAVSLAAGIATMDAVTGNDVPAMVNETGRELRDAWMLISGGIRDRVVLRGYPSRLVWSWSDPEDARVFGEALIANGVLCAGYVNVTAAWGREEQAHMRRAMTTGVEAVRQRVRAAA